MKIDISVIGYYKDPADKEKLEEELNYLKRILTNSLGFTEIRDNYDGSFDSRIISFIKDTKQ